MTDADTDPLSVTIFLSWWKDDPGRSLCTLEQAIGAYLATFPARGPKLLVDLLTPYAPND